MQDNITYKKISKKLFQFSWNSFFCIVLLFQTFFLFAQTNDSVYIPNDTVFIDESNFLVKVTASYYTKPIYLKNVAQQKAIYYNGIDYWFDESYEYYRNGNLKLINFLQYDSIPDTFALIYYKHFYKNGNLSDEGQIATNPFFDNQYIYYYKNGYKERFISVKDSLYHGSYKSYYNNGQLKTPRVYDEGKLMEVKHYYDATGFPLDKGTLENGNGTVIIYDNKGRQKEVFVYKEGLYLTKLKKID